MLILKLAIVGWLPGAVVFRAPVAERHRRAALPIEERVFWQVVLSAAVTMAIVLALAAAHRYSFSRLLIADVLVAAAVAGVSRGRLRLGGAAGLRWSVLLPIALVVVGVWRFFPPAEYIIGGKDPGVYMNEGIQIAQRGALVLDDQTIASVPPFARDLFFPQYVGQPYYSVPFMGFFILDPGTGAVVGQFPHAYPASIAVAYGIDGLTGARRVVGVWAVLGLLAVFFAGARLFGRTAAFAAAVLLAMNVVQVWFARYPNSEMPMQALLFAALLAAGHTFVDGDPFFAPVAGSLLAMLLFLRIDAVIATATIVTAVALLHVRRAPMRVLFWVPLLAGAALAAWYLVGPMRAYAALPIGFAEHLAVWEDGLLAVAAAAVLVMLFASRRRPLAARWIGRVAPAVVTGAGVGLAIYAEWFRTPSGRLAAHDAYALRTFTAYYLTLPGLVAALLGLIAIARPLFWRGPALILTVVGYAAFFFYKIRIVPDHFWLARRFVPAILPGALLLVGAAAFAGARTDWVATRTGLRVRLPGIGSVRRLVGLAFVVLLALQYARAAAPVLPHVEYAGVIPRLERLAGTIGDHDLLIVESRNASDAHVLALPLAYVYARHVLVLNTPAPDKAAFAIFLDWARTKYARVLFLGGGGTDLRSPAWHAEYLTGDRFEVPEYDSPYDAYPRGIHQKKFDYDVYALTPPEPVPADGFAVDVGFRDDLDVLRFYARETSGTHTFRWSKDRSYITVPRLAASVGTLTLWMNNGGRPRGLPAADVRVLLDGHPLGTVRVNDGYAPYTLAIPAAVASDVAHAAAPVRMTLETSTWNPHRLFGAPDDRDLGVIVDRVAIR